MSESTTAGRTFEDFVVGEVIRHPIGRTVTATDNAWTTLIAVNSNPIHFDAHYSAQTEFGRPLVNSPLTLAIVTGLSVADISRYAVNLGWDEVRMPAPVFEGDTIYAQSEVVSARDSKSRPNMGVVEVKTTGFKQDGTVVMTYRRTILVYRRGHVPMVPVPTPKG
ncbi:MAG TPA: MaoC family dehydratase [Gemmatimonadaceae bacterium]|jgi:acyl dehydratase